MTRSLCCCRRLPLPSTVKKRKSQSIVFWNAGCFKLVSPKGAFPAHFQQFLLLTIVVFQVGKHDDKHPMRLQAAQQQIFRPGYSPNHNGNSLSIFQGAKDRLQRLPQDSSSLPKSKIHATLLVMKKIIETTEKSLRLNQYLALYGFCSRRLADELIRQGDVTINHWVTKKPSYLVQEKDAVRINKKLIKPTAHQPLYIVLNKPIGFVTTARDEKGRATVLDLIGKQPQRVFPVGRLDITTSGVLLLTNDGT